MARNFNQATSSAETPRCVAHTLWGSSSSRRRCRLKATGGGAVVTRLYSPPTPAPVPDSVDKSNGRKKCRQLMPQFISTATRRRCCCCAVAAATNGRKGPKAIIKNKNYQTKLTRDKARAEAAWKGEDNGERVAEGKGEQELDKEGVLKGRRDSYIELCRSQRKLTSSIKFVACNTTECATMCGTVFVYMCVRMCVCMCVCKAEAQRHVKTP